MQKFLVNFKYWSRKEKEDEGGNLGGEGGEGKGKHIRKKQGKGKGENLKDEKRNGEKRKQGGGRVEIRR